MGMRGCVCVAKCMRLNNFLLIVYAPSSVAFPNDRTGRKYGIGNISTNRGRYYGDNVERSRRGEI